MTGVREAGGERLLDEAYLHGECLQPPQSAFGLVQVVNLFLNLLPQRLIDFFYVE